MAGLQPLPETVLHTSTRLTHSQAHDLLSSFLETAQTNPAYRPDAILTQHGPQASSVGEGSNLTLNHLGRILKGIRGERVGGVEFNYGQGPPKRRKVDSEQAAQSNGFTSSPPVVSNGQQSQQKDSQHQNANGVNGAVVPREGMDGQGEAGIVTQETDDWQPKEDYEHAQIDDTEDVGAVDRDPADGGHDRGDDLEVTSLAGGPRTMAEKDARKMAKKDRRKQDKVERERERQKGNKKERRKSQDVE